MKIGFTGTRKGMTDIQKKTLIHELAGYKDWIKKLKEHHNGMCKGSDKEFYYILRKELGYSGKVIFHPSNLKGTTFNLFCHGQDMILLEKPSLERNHDIVNSVKVMFATPDGQERVRSGTWATIRYAKKKKVETYIIYPDGKVIAIMFPYGKMQEYVVTPAKCPECESFDWKQVPSEYPILECKDCGERWLND